MESIDILNRKMVLFNCAEKNSGSNMENVSEETVKVRDHVGSDRERET